MTRVTFGFILPQVPRNPDRRITFLEDLNGALKKISGAFDSMWVIDHLMNMENRLNGLDDIESFTTLAYLAALHPQLDVGHTVVCQSFRNPALVAKMGATLQFLCGGRFRLGIGAGGDESEHRAYGYDFPPARTRVEQLEEALQIIKALWSEPVPGSDGAISFSGQHYRLNEAICEPKPVPIPPILVGAFQPKMLRLTARYADEWNVSSTGPRSYRRLLEAFDHACLDVGRDPATVRRSWAGGCVCMPTREEAERVAGERYRIDLEDDYNFVGTPRDIIEQMNSFIEMGVRSFMIDCAGFPDLTTLDLIINEVIPEINN